MKTPAAEAMLGHLSEVAEANRESVVEVATLVVRAIENGGLIRVAATGHSTAMMLETFYRAGGLACVSPLYHPALNPLEGAVLSTVLEREEEFVPAFLSGVRLDPADVGVVASNSGINAVPVRTAQAFAAAGLPVVAVMSTVHCSQAPRRVDATLMDVADVILDTRAPYGDAMLGTEQHRVGAISTVASAFLWNLVLDEVVARWPSDEPLPMWQSANTAVGQAPNQRWLSQYGPQVPRL